MNPTITSVGGRVPPGEIRRRLAQDLVGSAGLTQLLRERLVLRLELLHPLHLGTSQAVAGIGFANPGPDRLDAIAELISDTLHRAVLAAQLLAQLAHQPHRVGLLTIGIPTRRRTPRGLLLRHDSILVSKVWSLHASQGGSTSARHGVRRRR